MGNQITIPSPPPLRVFHLYLDPENSQSPPNGRCWHACAAPTATDAIYAVLNAYEAWEFKPSVVWLLVSNRPSVFPGVPFVADKFHLTWAPSNGIAGLTIGWQWIPGDAFDGVALEEMEINFDEHVKSARVNFEAELVESAKEDPPSYTLTYDHLGDKPMRTPSHPGQDVEFRLYDDDDVLYFTGVMTMALYRSADILDPLDYAEGQWGCTRQDCKNPLSGEWETI